MCDYQNKFLSLKTALISIPVYVLMFCICYVAKTNAQNVVAKTNAQNIYDSKNLKCNNGYCTTVDGTPVTGLVKGYYISGELRTESNRKDGKLNGVAKWYYKSGALEEVVNFKDGKQYGILKEYYESGALAAESNWKDNEADGVMKEYYKSGTLKSESNWRYNKQNGVAKWYYESGALEAELNWKNDKQNGVAKWYYESGALDVEENWKDGKADGIIKEYYESGALKSESNWKDDKQNGLRKEYYESGALKSASNWKDDKQNGITKNYDKNGILISETRFDANEFKAPAVCIGAALQALMCASNSAFSQRIAWDMTNELTDCFNSEYPDVPSNDFLEYYDEGKDMVLRATNHCNYVPPAISVVSNYCRNMDELDRCVYRSKLGQYTGADTISRAVYTLISRWR